VYPYLLFSLSIPSSFLDGDNFPFDFTTAAAFIVVVVDIVVVVLFDVRFVGVTFTIVGL